MAGSRLEKFGTVFTRVRDLMRSGVIKESVKPIWYDVYEAFPPKTDPLYVKPVTRYYGKNEEAVPEIFYKEDEIRARFYAYYWTGHKAFDLSKSDFVSLCQRFVDKYTELEYRGELEESSLFKETGKALLAEGVDLRKEHEVMVSPEPRDPVLGLKLTDMLAEQQTDGSVESQKSVEQTSQTSP